jgi:hypothetical protein
MASFCFNKHAIEIRFYFFTITVWNAAAMDRRVLSSSASKCGREKSKSKLLISWRFYRGSSNEAALRFPNAVENMRGSLIKSCSARFSLEKSGTKRLKFDILNFKINVTN